MTRMQSFRKLLPGILPVLLLAGCFGTPGASGPDLSGNEYGASSSLAQDEASAAIAALLRDDFGQALQPSDHEAVAAAQAQALRTRGTGAAISWNNTRTGHSGQVRPGPLYQVNTTTCREVTHEMIVEERRYVSRGTACKGPQGDWETLS
ncbi:RT0821/Lpp0805 family surface protein [Roseibium limicola]|uniref:Surface antigen domain-containing protein n=1 Tax=Roseibium limicola TaxID=2816037 RepID=A0A939EMA1_9HYPH|nr:RT0821/Lpp0805 family surface protein [Roseibium limicola]MBO0345179.1 hypothetical protein [Roseibium limicola]